MLLSVSSCVLSAYGMGRQELLFGRSRLHGVMYEQCAQHCGTKGKGEALAPLIPIHRAEEIG